jgi:hypothetical protein
VPIEGPDYRDVKTARVNATVAGGDNTLVPAVAGKIIRLLGSELTAATAAGVVTLKDGAGNILATENLPLATPVGYAGGDDAPVGDTAPGQALVLTTVATQTVTGHLAYLLMSP